MRRAFFSLGMDALVLGSFLVEKWHENSLPLPTAALFGGGPDMNIIARSIASLFLHHQSAILKLRNQPIIGRVLSLVSRRLLRSDALVWVQIQGGPGDGLWLYLN